VSIWQSHKQEYIDPLFGPELFGIGTGVPNARMLNVSNAWNAKKA